MSIADRLTSLAPPAPEWLRRTVLASYAFLGVWVLIGLICLCHAVFSGAGLRALITTGVTLVGAGAVLAMLTLLRIGVLLIHNTTTLDRIREQITGAEARLREQSEQVKRSAIGPGDPQTLVAGSIATDSYPRLATGNKKEMGPAAAAVENEAAVGEAASSPSPAVSRSVSERSGETASPVSTEPLAEEAARIRPAEPGGERGDAEPAKAPTVPIDAGVERRWLEAFERADLAGCRQILEQAPGDGGLSSERLAAMREWLDAALHERRRALRETFADLVRQQRYSEALTKGDEIVELFPDSAMATEFKRLRPYLEARGNGAPAKSRAPTV